MKKQYLKRFATILLACTMLFVGCGNNDNDGDSKTDNNGKGSTVVGVQREVFKDGVHQYNYTDTENLMAEHGTSSYKIVVEDDPAEEIVIAATELQTLFKEATGATLSIVKASSVSYSENSQFIVLGKNKVFENAGLTTSGLNLGLNGYIIKTNGKSVFIAGDDVYGTQFGVYQFLEIEFNFDCFAADCYTIDKKDTVMLKNYNVLDLPDIKTRSIGAYAINGRAAENRMRFMPRGEELFAGTIGVHSTFECFPKEEYLSKYPEFYNSEQNELCYTARGDSELYAKMQEIALEYVKYNFMDNTRANIITFSHQDTQSWCYCSACAAERERYGAFSATAIHFLNKLAESVEAWMKTAEGTPYARDFRIVFLAYTTTEAAPVNYNESTDTFTPVDETVVLNKHVLPIFAPVSMDVQNSFYEDINKSVYKNLRSWRALSDEICVYNYHTNYADYFSFIDTFEQMHDMYILAANSNTNWMFDLGQEQGVGATGWENLKLYLASKYGWNVNYDFDQLVDKFFNAYYGPAADTMLKIFKEQRVRCAYNLEYEGLTVARSDYAVLTKENYWPKSLLDRWVGMYDEALQSIASLRFTDTETYNLYQKNIRMERLSVYYSMVKIYENAYSTDYMLSVKNECRDICEEAGIVKLAEGSENTVIALWTEWGIM